MIFLNARTKRIFKAEEEVRLMIEEKNLKKYVRYLTSVEPKYQLIETQRYLKEVSKL